MPEAIMYDIRCCADRNVTRSNAQSQVRRYGSLNWIPSDGSTSLMAVYIYIYILFLKLLREKETELYASLKGYILHHILLFLMEFEIFLMEEVNKTHVKVL